jgi:nicotinamidase-related amidase
MRKDKSASTRREFIAKTSMAGLGMVTTINSPFLMPEISVPDVSTDKKTLLVEPRYHRWHVDPGVEWLEVNTGYNSLTWKIPLSQTALVLLDVWQRHYLKDTEVRGEEIIQNNLIPLLTKCRKSGMPVIHAPSPEVAMKHQNWVKLLTQEEMKPKSDDWPPQDFLNSAGAFKSFDMPFEPREEERSKLPELTFHPDILPASGEPVVATGEELHRYCKQNGILFLFFAGFNTNACILTRDYGTIQMGNRGYKVIVIRDCTTGMESGETHNTLSQTNSAILFLEMFGHFSVTSEDIKSGFSF